MLKNCFYFPSKENYLKNLITTRFYLNTIFVQMSETVEMTDATSNERQEPMEDNSTILSPAELEKLTVQHYVVADVPRPHTSVLDESYGITWFNLAGTNLAEVETRVSLILDATHPVHVVCMAYQSMIGENVLTDVLDSVKRMQVKAASSGINKFSAASCMFKPDHHKEWDDYAQFNKKIREIAVEFKMQPLLLHKPLLERQRAQTVMCVNPSYYLEFLSGSSLGSTLTRDGWKKIMVPIVKHLTIGMFCKNPLVAKSDISSLSPTPCGLTDKYLRSPSMVEHLRERGLFVARPTRKGARSLSNPRNKQPKRKKFQHQPAEPRTSRDNPPRNEVKIPTITWRTRSTECDKSSCSSSGYSSSKSTRSRRSTSESASSVLSATRKENDLEDCVFYNAATDPGAEEVVSDTDRREKYHQMMTAYGKVVAENYELKLDLRSLNLQLIDLEKFKRRTMDEKDRDKEKELETLRYYDRVNERSIKRLEKKLRDAGREHGELVQDMLEWKNECRDLRKQNDELLDSRKELSEMYDNLLEESRDQREQKRDKKNKNRSKNTE